MTAILGFTGTRHGMTDVQRGTLAGWLAACDFSEGHHGDCIGADDEFDALLCVRGVTRVVHPPLNDGHRAFVHQRRPSGDVHLMPPKGYIERDREIVKVTECLIAAPFRMDEELRSGTWTTIRFARKLKKSIIIFYPDGSWATENWEA